MNSLEQESKWESELSSGLAQSYKQIKQCVAELDRLVKAFPKSRFYPHQLEEILAAWERCERYIVVRSICIRPCSPSPAYKGFVFHSPDDLKRRIAAELAIVNYWESALQDNDHSLEVNLS